MAISDNESITKKLLELLPFIKELPTTDFARRLHYKAWKAQGTQEFKEYHTLDQGRPWPGTDNNPSAPKLDDFSVVTELNELALSSVAHAIYEEDASLASKIDIEITNKVHNNVITELAFLCNVEHLNMALKNRPIHVDGRTFTDLAALRSSFHGLGGYMNGLITQLPFIEKVIEEDVSEGNYLRSMNLLFMADFLSRDQVLDFHESNDKRFFFEPSFEILSTWSHHLWEVKGKKNNAYTKKIVGLCGRAATAVYWPGNVQEPTSTYRVTKGLYEHIISKSSNDGEYRDEVREALSDLVQNDLDEWKSIYMGLSNTWFAAEFPLWRDAVKKEQKIDNGRNIKQWITDEYHREYDNTNYPAWRLLKPLSVVNGSYLLAGANIMLADRTTTQAEKLQRGDRLLTLAQPEQSSEVSNDIFPLEVTAPLIGFNDEEPFATTAQVFHTTTGLRAVNPDAAMRQNPWLQVGRLCVGHVVYRLGDGSAKSPGYDIVEVKSIQKTAAVKKMVYALRLQGGVRSHHVNGYLVNLNESEFTTKDVANLLGQFSVSDQKRLLSSVKEVRSMLMQFGPQTVWKRLQSELEGHTKMQKESWHSLLAPSLPTDSATSRRANAQSLLSHLSESFRLVPVNETQKSPVNSLPYITLMDGVLLLDGEVQLQTTMNDDDRVVSWTRKVEGRGFYEHGRLEVYNPAHGGTGALYYSSESDPKDLRNGDVVQVHASLTSALIPRYSHHSREEVFPPLVLNAVEETALSAPAASAAGEVANPPPAVTAVTQLGIKSKFVMTLDESPWPKDTKLENPKTPVSLGIIFTGVQTTAEGLSINSASIPQLDELQKAINDTRKGEKPITKLYSCHTENVPGENDENGNPTRITRTVVVFNQAAMASFVSDQGSSNTHMFNITFKNSLKSDLKLPVLFQSLYLDKNWNGTEVTGALYQYDPSVRGTKGQRHKITGKWEAAAMAAEDKQRAFVSKSFANFATPGLPISHDPKLQPAAITAFLSTQAVVTPQKLYLMSYNADDVHSLVQTTITEMMYYHMDDTQRQNFTTRTKPDAKVLGPELTTQLPEDLKDFLKKKYAPAFIARNVSQIEGYKNEFKEDEADKVWYWWAGQGSECLSKSKEYSKLNNVASIHAMKTKYPILKMEPSKSVTLAKDFYGAVIVPALMEKVPQEGDQTGHKINQVCVILHTLDPESNYAHDWFRLITQYCMDNDAQLPFIKDLDGKYVEEWLKDALQELIVKVLHNEATVSGPVREELVKDLEEFKKANGISQGWTIERQAASIVEKMSAFTVEVAHMLEVTGSGLAKAFRGTRLFELAGAMAEKAKNFVKNVPFGETIAKSLGTICVVAFFVGQILPLIGVIEGWKSLTPAQRATGILEALRGVLTAADKAFEEFKRFKGSGGTEAERAVDSAVLNESLGKELTTTKGKKLVDLGDEVSKKGEGLEMAMANRIKKAGVVKSDEKIVGDREVWDESIEKKPSGLVPGEEETASKLSTTSKWIRGLNIVLGFAVSASMTFSLVQDWDKLTDVGKVINTIAVVTQILSVIVDIVDLAITTGLIASATLSVAIPVIGAILAVIGIIIMIVSLFINLYKKPPTPNPVGDFITKVARPLIEKWNKPPTTKLKYKLEPSEVHASAQHTIKVVCENTGNDVSLANTQISIWTGDSPDCLFSETAFALEKEKAEGGKIAVSPTELAEGTLQSTLLNEKLKYWVYNLWCSGKRNETTNVGGELKLPSMKKLEASWTGKIDSAGKSFVEIVELFTDGDTAHIVLPIKRV